MTPSEPGLWAGLYACLIVLAGGAACALGAWLIHRTGWLDWIWQVDEANKFEED